MPLNLERKKRIVEQVSLVANDSCSLILVDYAGLTADSLDRLRAMARTEGVRACVIPNRLMKRALSETQFFSDLEGDLKGQLLFIFSSLVASPGSGARVLKEFKKISKAPLLVRKIAVEKKSFPGSCLDEVAMIPSREEALSLLAGSFSFPIRGALCFLTEIPRRFLRLLHIIADSKKDISESQ